jgi:hypothetical protein
LAWLRSLRLRRRNRVMRRLHSAPAARPSLPATFPPPPNRSSRPSMPAWTMPPCGSILLSASIVPANMPRPHSSFAMWRSGIRHCGRWRPTTWAWRFFRLQSLAQAEAAFRSVRQDPQADPELLALAAEMLDRISGPQRRASPSRLAYFDLAAGHDSNVVLADESLLEAGRDGSSAYLQAFAWYSGARSEASGPRFDISGYAVRYADAGEYDQNLARLGGAWRFGAGDWQMDPGLYLSYSTLGGDGFERRSGVMLDMRRDLGRAPRWRCAARRSRWTN